MHMKKYIVEMGPRSNKVGRPHPLTAYEPVMAYTESQARQVADNDFMMSNSSRMRHRGKPPAVVRTMMTFHPIAAIEVE